MVHIRFDGRSHDLKNEQLGVSENMTDGDVKARVAAFLDLSNAALERHIVDRPGTDTIIVRPEAVYG